MGVSIIMGCDGRILYLWVDQEMYFELLDIQSNGINLEISFCHFFFNSSSCYCCFNCLYVMMSDELMLHTGQLQNIFNIYFVTVFYSHHSYSPGILFTVFLNDFVLFISCLYLCPSNQTSYVL